MPKFIKKISKKVGLAPGTLVHIGEKKVENPRITVIDYDRDLWVLPQVGHGAGGGYIGEDDVLIVKNPKRPLGRDIRFPRLARRSYKCRVNLGDYFFCFF